MKTIKYTNYKKNEKFYTQVKNTYNSEDKTIQVYDSKKIEFDLEKEEIGRLHIKTYCKNIEDKKAFIEYDSDYIIDNDLKDSFFNCDMIYLTSYEEFTFYKDNREVFDKFLLLNNIDVTSELSSRFKLKAFKLLKNLMKELQENLFLTYEELCNSNENKIIFNIEIRDIEE